MPPGREDVVIASLLATEPAIEICRFDFADSGVYLVESVTVKVTDTVPDPVGTPAIAPVELLMDSPAGRPLAVYLYGVVPPVAVNRPL